MDKKIFSKEEIRELNPVSKNYNLGHLTSKGDLEQVKSFLEEGADPNFTRIDINAARPLETAFSRGDLAMVNLLLEHGADPRANFHLTQLNECVDHSPNYRELIRAVIDKHPNENDIARVINHCSKRGDGEFVNEMLVKYGDGDLADLRPSMIDACRGGHTEIVEALHKHGVDIEANDLTNAASNGHAETVRASVSLKDFTQEQLDGAMIDTLLKTGSYEKIKPLLMAGADPHAKNDRLWSVCETTQNKEVVGRLIVDCGYKPPPKAEFGLSMSDDDFSKQVNATLAKVALNEKLSQNLKPQQAIVKTKTRTMKI